MSKVTIHPEEVLKALLAKGPRSNKASTLKALHEICLNQYQRQSALLRDFRLSAIGPICESQGLFKARVLYNAASHDYVALIAAWATFSGTVPVKAQHKPNEQHLRYQYLMRIEDPALRALMQSTIVERDNLRAQVNLLKTQTKITIDQRPMGAAFLKDLTPVTMLNVVPQLTDSEREALEKAISTTFLNQEGWTVGSHGEVINQHGRTVYDVGYITAIRKIIDRR